jgi:hypothetical protein
VATGNTGWVRPAGGSVIVHTGDSGVTPSNVSNIVAEDSNNLTVNLANSGGASLQLNKVLLWNWQDPGGYPSNAWVTGVEMVIYWQYKTSTGNSRDVALYEYKTSWANTVSGTFSLTGFTGQAPYAASGEPVPNNNLDTYGGPGQLFSTPAQKLVSEFLSYKPHLGPNSQYYANWLRMVCETGGTGTAPAEIKVGHIKLKLYWQNPNTIDMACTPSISATLAAPVIQRVRDVAATPSGSVTQSQSLKADFSLAAAPVIDTLILGDISEAGYTDNTANLGVSVDLAVSDLIRYRNMVCEPYCSVQALMTVGNSAPIACDMALDVSSMPYLQREQELQTDAVSATFEIIIDQPPAPDGTIQVRANAPISVSITGHEMLVNWALYSRPTANVSAAAAANRMTNMYVDMSADVALLGNVVQNVNLDCDMTMNGFLLNTRFSKLPVPTLEERYLVLDPRERDFVVPAPDRTLVIKGQQGS